MSDDCREELLTLRRSEAWRRENSERERLAKSLVDLTDRRCRYRDLIAGRIVCEVLDLVDARAAYIRAATELGEYQIERLRTARAPLVSPAPAAPAEGVGAGR